MSFSQSFSRMRAPLCAVGLAAMMAGCHTSPGEDVSNPDNQNESNAQTDQSTDLESFSFHYSNFSYPPEQLQDAKLIEYFEDHENRLRVQSADATLRELHYVAEPAGVALFLEEVERHNAWSDDVRQHARRLLDRYDTLTKLDRETVPSFVRQAVKRKDVDALCAALMANSPGSLTTIVFGLHRLNDVRSVRTLAYHVRSLVGYPSTGFGWNTDLRNTQAEASYSALFNITGVAPVNFKDTSDDAIRAYLRLVDRWCVDILSPLENPR